MWPFEELSLSAASRIGDVANWVLLASLVTGLVATFFIVQMGNVKEGHWDRERDTSRERTSELNRETARLSMETDEARRKIAEANARQAAAEQKTAEINLYIEQITQWRTLSSENTTSVSNSLLPFSGTPFSIAIVVGDPESDSLARQIEVALESAKWIEFGWQSPLVLSRGDKPAFGFITGTGVLVRVNSAFKTNFEPAANALAAALNAVGIRSAAFADDDESNKDVVQILVATKPKPVRPPP